MSSLEVLSAAGLRCKLRSHDQGARVTTTKRRKSTLVSLSRSCQPGLERTRGLPRHSLHAFVARKSSGSGSGSSDGRAMLQKALDLLAESRRETKRLQEALKEQMEMTRELKEAVAKQEETVHEMGKQMVEIKEQMTEELQRVCEQPGEDEARLSAGTIRATVENEVRSELDNPTWRCRAVTKDPKNPHRVRITCRDENKHEIVKRVAETKLAPGARILRDDLYPIRVDNVSRIAVLNERNEVRIEITEMLG
ncbi:hypothetical protein FOTG_15326 [Fusarium oxysporum f. sp. vasinfectum 25433]|uniref:Uncharacterized protein n=1 Tax=Fusarium oxysporum f. sp. vasinfectum 25433 TaxID=1089449 RepID=X0KS12_FUSOX|nr:hypothetical protein FOTG_15326 [Fusarium oxysporum f. sp. vasinfectum 25433]